MSRIVTRNGPSIEHSAVKFWHRIGLNRAKPEAIVVLKEYRKKAKGM